MKASDVLFVGYDCTDGKDETILTVAKRVNGVMTIINAYQGREAEELYYKLATINPELLEKRRK